MSSTDDGSEQKSSPKPSLPMKKIMERISALHNILASLKEAEADSAQQTTVSTDTAANNQTGNEQDDSNSGNVSHENSNNTNKQDGYVSQGNSNKQDGDVGQEKQEDVAPEKTGETQSNKRNEVLRELDKLSKELDYMVRSFEKLERFETDLSESLKTLEDNVYDILKDLPQVKVDWLPKQVPLNLRVLRNNITRVKIRIPLQHQTASTNSEANRALQTTVATTEAGDLPYLFNEEIFESSYYFKEIKIKYETLEHREKLCLFCFSIFPENAEIKKRLLRFWWVGENLVIAKSSDEEKKLVSKILQELVDRGFIKPVLKKNKLQPRSYTMSPIVRSCLIKFAKDNRFFDYNDEGKPTMNFSSSKKACMVKSQGAPVGWLSGYLKEPAAVTTKRLPADLVKLQMLFNFPDQDTLEKTSRQFDKLQTLFNISKQFPALPKEWFSKMTGINVLFLGRWESSAGRQRHIEVEDSDFLKGFKNMKKLKLLSLQGISGITKIPSTLCKLEDLRILDLRACHNLEKLPERIGLLKKLTYLDLSECYLLDEMPKQLSKLSELQILKGFVISGDKNSCTLDELSELGNLRKLSVDVNTSEFNIDDAGKALSKFENLEKLKIAWGSGGLKRNNSKQEKDEAKSEMRNVKKESSRAKSSTGKQNKGDNKSPGIYVISKMYVFINRLGGRNQKRRNPQGLERLVKLDLQCYPRSAPPNWLAPENMIRLTNLCIRGGTLRHLNHSDVALWKVETLRLKYLLGFKMNWIEIRERFPKLKYLEKVRCPRITICPCDANGVWQKSSENS